MIARSLPGIGLFVCLSGLFAASNAFALTSLKQVQVSNGERVDLYFDGKIGRSQIKTEYFNDTIQFSLADVSVYPAKISSVTGGDISKIFAYQYAPKLVRCRITVHGKAESFRDRIKIDDRGKLLTISLSDSDGASDTVATHSAQAVRAQEAPTIQEGPQPARARSAYEKIGSSEKSLLDRIMKDSPTSAPARVIEEKKTQALAQAESPVAQPAQSAGTVRSGEPGENVPLKFGSSPIAGGKPLASPMRVMGKFAIVLGLFGLFAVALRKILAGGANRLTTKNHGSFGAIRRFAANRLGKPAKMIEIVSTQHLGPKKSIVIANIAGRMLVLGVSNESINLITQLSNEDEEGSSPVDVDLEGPADADGPSFANAPRLASRGPVSPFAGLLESEDAKPALPPAISSGAVRNQIRSRLEGLKQL